MTGPQILQIAVACIAAGTPWLVTRVALAVAARHAAAVGAPFPVPRAVPHLTRATLLLLPLVVVAAFVLAPPSLLMSAIDVLAFAGLAAFGLRALGAIDTASRRARDVRAAERQASLRPRRLGQYAPLSVRLTLLAIAALAVAGLGWRLDTVPANRLLMPAALILAGPVFLWLYEVWMRNEIAGGADVAGEREADARRRRRVRQILTAEGILVIGLAAIGHALLGLDRTEHGVQVAIGAFAGSLLAIMGCALALSSDLARRRYQPAAMARPEDGRRISD
jgi:hypothetical protein